MVRAFRDAGVRTVVWVTPWVNLESADGQMPPDAASRALHDAPASNYAAGADGRPLRARRRRRAVRRALVDGHRLADRLHVAGRRGVVARAGQARARARRRGHQGRRRRGLLLPRRRALRRRQRPARTAAWAHRRRATARSMQRALDEVHPGRGVLFGRSGWSGQQATGMLWGGDQVSDFWSLRVLVAATLSAAASGFSNWSHDVGGYLGHRLVERCPAELLVRWAQLGCFTPLMQAHGRLVQEPWTYDERTLRHLPLLRPAARAPRARTSAPPPRRPRAAACRSSARCTSLDPADERGWTIADAFGYGPALWVAPVLDEGARSREVALPRGDWIETWSGARVRGGGEVVAPAPRDTIPVWVRSGLDRRDVPGRARRRGPRRHARGTSARWRRRCGASRGWAARRCGSPTARGSRWRRGRWSVDREREIVFAER